MTRLVVAAELVLFATLAVAQTVFKWVDEKGVTHYSEKPPEDRKSSKVEIKVEPAKPGADDWKAREQQFRQRQIEQSQKADAEAQQKAKADGERAKRCARARESLDTLRNARRVHTLNDKGERVYMEDGERPAEIAKWEREAADACR